MTNGISRRELLRRLLMAGGILVTSPLIAACQTSTPSETLARARQRGFIRVGFAEEPPYAYVADSGEVTGQAPTLAREVMRRLGVRELDWVLTSFGSLIPGLQEGRFDIIAAGMFITSDRCTEILFSDPDYCTQQALLVAARNPFGITRYEDIAANAQVRLGVMTGAVEVSHAQESGIPLDQVTRFDATTDLVDAVQTGLIDVAALTTITLGRLAQTTDFTGLEVTEAFTHGDELGCGAFGFRKDDTDFRDEFNDLLRTMKDSGEIVELVTPFGFSTAAEAARDLKAEDLCAS